MFPRNWPIKTASFWFGALLTVLFIIWPISRTIALRNALLLVLCVWAGRAALARLRPLVLSPPVRAPLLWLGALTLWMVVEVVFTPFWGRALMSVRGQWLSALLAGLLGMLVAAGGQGLPRARTVTALFAAVLLFHVLVVDWQGLLWMVAHHSWPHDLAGRRIKGLTAGPDKANYLTNLLLDLVVAAWMSRLEGQGFTFLTNRRFALVVAAAFLSFYFEAMRNGLGDILILAAFVVSRLVWQRRHRMTVRSWVALGAVVFGALLAVGLDVAFDPRWDTLFATVPIAWNTKLYHLAWQYPGSPLPHLPNGQPVSQSNYLRIAWIKEGLKCVLAYPWGVGYSRRAFGAALFLRYGRHLPATSTNNGILNLAVGVGVPGVLLWFGWIAATLRSAAQRLSGRRLFFALALLLIVLDVCSRNLVDANLQDYMLQEFFFMAGFLLVSLDSVTSRDANTGAAPL